MDKKDKEVLATVGAVAAVVSICAFIVVAGCIAVMEEGEVK